jgi:hypothetical protein
MTLATHSNNILYHQISKVDKSKEIGEFKYENSPISLDLINKCNSLSIEYGETYFIFDKSISNMIKKREEKKKEKREILIDDIMDDENEKYHIGTDIFFKEMPSRFSYYDTETKETNRYKKYNILVNFLNKIGFVSNTEFNFGPEYDQSFLLKIEEKSFIARVKPNLFLSIQEGFYESGNPKIIFEKFFSRKGIIKSLSSYIELKSNLLDLKLEEIL